jgi:16S rRNA (cytosine1402-N4)-methyltransferase
MADETPSPHRRRPRYAGKNPRRFEEKYKEHGGDAETLAKVLAAGKTPAGTHRPIMVAEILAILAPQPGEVAVDCTLGYGGHAQELLGRLQPGGKLLGLDADPLELPKTEARLRALGFGEETFVTQRTNFAALPQALAAHGLDGADMLLADLGLSSMQIDDPARGFSVKTDGPLEMRLNPQRGQPVSAFLQKITPEPLAKLLTENADEPHAEPLASALAGKFFPTTSALAAAICDALPRLKKEESELTVRRVFQSLRIAVNDEFAVLDALLRQLPDCLRPGGRAAFLTFHSGEDRRVKKALEAGHRAGLFSAINDKVIRASPAERNANPRSTSAKLRWARKAR